MHVECPTGHLSHAVNVRRDKEDPRPSGRGSRREEVFWDDIFGDVSYREVTDPWQIKPGDLIQEEYHWSIAVSNPFSSQFYTDPCVVTVGGGKAGSIGWADPSGVPLGNTVLAIYTRYPLPYEFEDSEVHLTTTIRRSVSIRGKPSLLRLLPRLLPIPVLLNQSHGGGNLLLLGPALWDRPRRQFFPQGPD